MLVSLLSLRRLLVPAVLLVFPLSALAQFNASVQGTVTDSSGAVVPNATVTVTNQATSIGRSTRTSSNGFYNVTALPPGTYMVEVKAPGFETSTSSGVVVAAEQPRGLNVQLKTGTASETVQVTENMAPLQTENANVQGEITSRQVQELPSYGRDPYSDLRLAPGVFGTGALSGGGGMLTLPNTTGPGASNLGIFQTENQIPISANGQRVSSNNYMIDGVSVNSQTWGGAAVVTPNMDAVQEMSVTANTYNAQDSRNSGAIVRVVTKSGSNQFHGDGWFQYQDPNFNSYNKYGGPAAGELPVRVDNNWKQFGGSLGGPILKDKLFFFFSYEGLRSTSDSFSVPTWIETSQYRQLIGNLFPGSFADQVINSSGMAPRINTVLTPSCQIFQAASWPCQVVGNGVDIGSPTGGLGTYAPGVAGGGLDGIPDLQYVQLIQPNTARPNQYNGRVDYHWGQQLFSASGFLTKSYLVTPDGYSRPADDVRYKPTNEALMLSWVSTISPTLLNEARFNVTRWAYNELSSAITNWGIPGVDAEQFPTGFRIQWGQQGNNSGTPAIFAENTYEASDFLTKVWGVHTLKFGGQYDWEQNNDIPVGQIRPQYAFSFWNLVNSAPLFEGITANPVTGLPTTGPSHFRTHYYAAFVQDDWKLKPNFTVNLGLRYEFFSPLSEVNGLTTNFFPGPTYSTALTDASVQPVSQYYKPDRNNFAPRVGFAWSPQRYNNNMVVRGGFGVAYDRIPEALLIPSRQNPPYQASFGFCCGGATNPFDGGLIVLATTNSIYNYPLSPLVKSQLPLGPNNLPTGSGASVQLYGTPQNMPNPYTYVYSLEVEQQLPAQFVLTMGYQGSETRKETRLLNQNYIFSTPNPVLAGGVFLVEPDINGNFNALLVRVNRRFSHGFQLLGNYRWSHSLDELSYGGPGFVTNQTFPSNLKYEYGPSDFDARHFANVSGIWQLPFSGRKDLLGTLLGGFQLSGIFTFNTGLPWTPVQYAYCLPQPGQCISPTRPTEVIANPIYSNSTYALTTQGVNFPGGGSAYFASPAGSTLPAIGRNSFRGPGFKSVDMSIQKNFRLDTAGLPEGSLIQLRMNAYNVFNILNLSPFNFGDSNTNYLDPTFGRAISATSGRVLELEARFQF
jgi:hypothetical protein